MKHSGKISLRARIIVSVLIAAITVPVVLYATADDVQAKKHIGVIGLIDNEPVFGMIDDGDSEPSVSDPYAGHYDENGKWISEAEARSNANNRIGAVYSKDGKPVPGVSIGRQEQGEAAMAAFKSNMPAGYSCAFTFSISVNGVNDTLKKDGNLTFFIPWACQKAGREFKLLGLDKEGNVHEFKDTDSLAASFTTDLDIEGFAFMFIFKD